MTLLAFTVRKTVLVADAGAVFLWAFGINEKSPY
jgi:hypothetical protein